MKEKPTYDELERRLCEAEELIDKLKSGSPGLRNETLYSNLMENSIDAVYLLSEKGKVLEVNSLACKMLNYTRNELRALSIGDIDTNYDREGFQKFWAPRPKEETLLFESKHRRKDGSVFPVEVNGIAFYLEGEKLLFGVARDITKRKADEQKLNKTVEQFRFLAENTQDLIVLHSPNGDFQYISPAVERLLGYTVEEYARFGPYENIYPEDQERVQNTTESILQGVDNTRIEFRLYKKDQTLIWFETRTRVIRDGRGHPQAILSSSSDITQRKEAEARIRESEEQFRVLAESSPIGIYQTDKEGKCVYANPKWQEMADMKLEECLGDNWVKALFKQDLKAIQKKWKETVKSGKAWEHEYRFKRKDGKIIWVYGTATPVKDKKGNTTGYIGNNVDITERKLAEEALAESEERFNLAMNASNDGLWDWKYGTDEIYFSRQWKEMLGYKEEEIKNSFAEWERLTHPEDVEESFNVLQEHIKGKRDRFEMEFRMKHKDGHWVDILSRAEVIIDQEQKPYRVIGTHVDLSRIRRIEEELRNSEERYRELVETINSGVAIYQVQNEGKLGKDYIIKSFNKTALEIENKTLEEVVGKSLYDLRPNIEKYGLIDIFRKVWETGETVFYPARVYVDENYYNWYENRVFRLPSGEIVAVYDDVTERQQALEALKESERQFRDVIQQAGDGILIVDQEGNILDANRQATEDLGYSREEFAALKVTDIDKKLGADRYKNQLWKKARPNKPVFFETIHTRKDGSEYPAELIVSKSKYAGKDVLIGLARNLTERKAFEEELKFAKEKAEESDRLKSAFMANMSHEIRTPLNGILGFSKLLSDTDTSEKEKERYSSIILNSGQRLLSVVNDILDISLIQANQLKLSSEKINIRDFLTELHTFYQTLMQDKLVNINFTISAPNQDGDLQMMADKNRLYQIIKNLLDNAFKFTKKGSIDFGYQATKGNTITFYVKDTGIGIPDNKQEQIFRAFEKADTSLNPEFGGTGLGLSIASGLVNRMGGNIWVESKKEKGAQFFFEIPLLRSEADEEQKAMVSQDAFLDLHGKQILVVEDDIVSFELLTNLLETTHARITHTISAEDGLKKMETNTFDLVLMDIRLPGMNGYEATQIIKDKYGDLPVIAQTAYAMQGDTQKALDAGCNDYISKPVDKNILFKKMSQYLA